MADHFTPQTIDMALQAIGGQICPIGQHETLSLAEVGGRVLAQPIVAPKNIPETPLSAMDGYAFSSDGLDKTNPQNPVVLKVLGKSLAGHALEGEARQEAAIRVFTGAAVPTEFDTVIPQELTSFDAGSSSVSFDPSTIRAGANVRARGEDLAQGAVALPAGSVIGPREIALLASMGVASIPVVRKLRVAVLSTGDEVTEPGHVLPAGKTFDTNRPMLLQLVRETGAEAIDLGIVRDDPESLRQAITRAASVADAVITSGGVSVGEADHTRNVMQSLGDIVFWKLAIKPGRPLAAGSIGDQRTPFFGLPGNPVAAFVTFHAIVRPCLARLAGVRAPARPPIRARLAKETKKAAGRTEYLRCQLYRDEHHQWIAEIAGSQGAASLKSLVDAHGLVVLPHDTGSLPAGALVDVIVLI